MKLELKHLVPYLPYGLKAKLSQEGRFNLDNECPNEYCNDICTITDFTTYSKDLGGSMKVDKTKDYSFDFDSLSEIEIILRPLSDLTKEIEHNGEKFVTIDYFEIGDDDNETYEYDNGNINLIQDLEYLSANRLSLDIVFIPYGVIQKLLEWHFDVFGLIEKNLAIDINTL